MSEDRPFIWRGRDLVLIRDLLDAVCALTSTGEAREFIAAYRAVSPHADANVGYIIGYVEPPERRQSLYELLNLSHPVFGGRP